MKYSLMTINIALSIFFKFQLNHDLEEAKEDYEEMMEMVQSAGYEAVDIISYEVSIFGQEYVSQLLKKYKLGISSYIHFAKLATVGEIESEAIIAEAKAAIDTAINLHTKVAMMVPQAQENIAEYTREQLAAALIKNLIPVTAYASSKGIDVVIEDTPDLRIPLCTAAELIYVLEGVPDLKVVYDSGNMLLVEEDPVVYYKMFAEKTAHIHIKDMCVTNPENMFADTAADGSKITGAMTGTGLIDIPAVVKAIKCSGYEGYLSVEYAPDEETDHHRGLKECRQYLKKLCEGSEK